MGAFADERGLMKKPIRYLNSGYKARRIAVITPLLKFWLDHGVVLQKVHRVVQWSDEACFEAFAAKVTENRRLGDADSLFAFLGEMWKLVGNAAYGKTITNKHEQRQTKL